MIDATRDKCFGKVFACSKPAERVRGTPLWRGKKVNPTITNKSDRPAFAPLNLHTAFPLLLLSLVKKRTCVFSPSPARSSAKLLHHYNASTAKHTRTSTLQPCPGKSSLVGTGNIDKAVICDIQGSAAWAASPGFNLSAAEMKAIATSFDDKSDPKSVISNGIKICGDKYMTIEAGEDNVKAKKGKEGIVAYKTTQAIIIAHHPEEIQTTNAYNSVVELGEYLKKVGY
ncbi:profilin ii [Pyrenophora seminiperda CCB06]|uniref:Profilin n=1 Tax=Pyrenophora seminiperda CCB06 TaxID=1302712 RepID=A0A3M7MCX4_9PLEO|nr:profilin ii [Pyrenophora seminiperda CCB06]